MHGERLLLLPFLYFTIQVVWKCFAGNISQGAALLHFTPCDQEPGSLRVSAAYVRASYETFTGLFQTLLQIQLEKQQRLERYSRAIPWRFLFTHGDVEKNPYYKLFLSSPLENS